MIKHITISPKDALEKLKEGNKRYITAEFNNLRPFHNRAPIYYNGYKIGNIINENSGESYIRLCKKDNSEFVIKIYKNRTIFA